VAALSHAISLSVALKRPERSFGRTTDSRFSSFTDGSTRVYISGGLRLRVAKSPRDLSQIFGRLLSLPMALLLFLPAIETA
jgi:hypothetical protein